jgi:hypothetical protein
LCDGTRSRGEILSGYSQKSIGGCPPLRMIHEFLDAAVERAWIVEFRSQEGPITP